MQSQFYKTTPNLSSNFSKPAPKLLDNILSFETKSQIPKLTKISNLSHFDELEIENYLYTMKLNLPFLVDKCYQIATLIGNYKHFENSDNLKNLSFLLFSISKKSTNILNQNKINIFN